MINRNRIQIIAIVDQKPLRMVDVQDNVSFGKHNRARAVLVER